MELIINSKSYGRHVIYYDEQDHWIISNHRKWHINKIGNVLYVGTNVYLGNRKARFTMLHRMIMPEAKRIDHIDGNGLNNLRNNLREVTHQQNMRNSRAPNTNKSGYKGVSKDGWTNLWRVWIEVDGKRISGGRHESKNKAASIYNELAIIHYGEYARLNIIDDAKEEILKYKTPIKRLIINE